MSNVLMFCWSLQAALHYKTFRASGHWDCCCHMTNAWVEPCTATISLRSFSLLLLLALRLLPLSNSGICWFYDCIPTSSFKSIKMLQNHFIYYSCVIFSIVKVQCFIYTIFQIILSTFEMNNKLTKRKKKK